MLSVLARVATVQSGGDRNDVVSSLCSCDNTCESVLDPLKSVEVGTGNVRDHELQ